MNSFYLPVVERFCSAYSRKSKLIFFGFFKNRIIPSTVTIFKYIYVLEWIYGLLIVEKFMDLPKSVKFE